MKRCTYCGRDNDDTVVHCEGCGTELRVSASDLSATGGIRFYIAGIAKIIERTTKRQKLIVACSAALLTAVFIYIASDYLHHPRLSVGEVIEVANAAAEADGFLLNEYNIFQTNFEFYSRNRTWTVFYSLKLPTPWKPLPRPRSAHGAPRDFEVIVDDKTKHTQVGISQVVGEGQPVKLPPGVKVLKIYTNLEWSGSNTN
jgi:hypothetical protein